MGAGPLNFLGGRQIEVLSGANMLQVDSTPLMGSCNLRTGISPPIPQGKQVDLLIGIDGKLLQFRQHARHHVSRQFLIKEFPHRFQSDGIPCNPKSLQPWIPTLGF